MAPLPEGRREVNPSREAMGERRKPGFGSKTGISVPISFGLPLIVVGLFLLVTGVATDGLFFLVLGGVTLAARMILFASRQAALKSWAYGSSTWLLLALLALALLFFLALVASLRLPLRFFFLHFFAFALPLPPACRGWAAEQPSSVAALVPV